VIVAPFLDEIIVENVPEWIIELVMDLAGRWGVEKAEMASFFRDVCGKMTDEQLTELIKRLMKGARSERDCVALLCADRRDLCEIVSGLSDNARKWILSLFPPEDTRREEDQDED
jgi:hypothetical protein